MNNRESKQNYEITYERENNCSYMVIMGDESFEEHYQIKMLKANKPKPFICLSTYEVNNKKCIYYNITSKQEMSKLFEYGKMTVDDVKSVFVSISEAVRTVDAYMLDIDKIILNPQHIYVSMADRQIAFIYYPGYVSNGFYESMRDLFEYIMEKFDHSLDKKQVVKLYEIYQKILVRDYDPYNLMWLFREDGEEEKKQTPMDEADCEQQIKSEESGQIIPDIIPEVIQPEEKEQPKQAGGYKDLAGKVVAGIFILNAVLNLFLKKYAFVKLPVVLSLFCIMAGMALLYLLNISGRRTRGAESSNACETEEVPYRMTDISITADIADDEAEKEVLTECSNTILLSDYIKSLQPSGLHVRLLDSEKKSVVFLEKGGCEDWDDGAVLLDNMPYIIGGMKKMSDIFIDTPVISKMHACISGFGKDYYIEDLNSTNGTFVNEKRLEGHDKHPLSDGDILRIADISFKVEIS